MSRFTLPVQYLRLVVEQIAVMGGDVEDCLRQAGLHSATRHCRANRYARRLAWSNSTWPCVPRW